VGPAHVELLVVADDRPVDGDVVLEDAVLDERAQLAQEVEPLGDGGGVSGALEVDVGTVTVGEPLDDLDRVLLGDVHDQVGPAQPGELQLLRRHVEGDDLGRELGLGPGDHAQADRAAAGDHHDVVEGDPGALDGVQRAGQRLGERGVGRGKVLAHLVHARLGAEHHVRRHAAGVAAPEAEHLVGAAHPVLAALAVAALPARHDLLGHDTVTDLDPPPAAGLVVEADDLADELVTGDDVRLRPGRAVLVTPELRGAVVALQVAGADADGLDPDERLAGAGTGHRHLLEAVVLRAVADDGLHRRGESLTLGGFAELGHVRPPWQWCAVRCPRPAHEGVIRATPRRNTTKISTVVHICPEQMCRNCPRIPVGTTVKSATTF
jgi:hypothetical protein